MAIYHLQIKSISRSAGRSATGAAAYRAGERIRDERTGVLYNYSSRRDVSYKEIVLPRRSATHQLEWAKDRAALWNAAERAETRRNSRVAREYEVALPPELSAAQRVQLALAFSRELADRHDVVVDLAVHEPRPAGDPRNYHAHLLTTTREISDAGLGAKGGLDMNHTTRQQRGLPPGIVEFNSIRERWALLTNEALHVAGLSLQVDHRSYHAQGIDREPHPHIPYAAIQAERHGLRSEIAEHLRERYRVRVQERAQRREQPPPLPAQLAQTPQIVPEPQLTVAGSAVRTLDQVRQQAREQWLQMRRQVLQPAAAPATKALERDITDDFTP